MRVTAVYKGMREAIYVYLIWKMPSALEKIVACSDDRKFWNKQKVGTVA